MGKKYRVGVFDSGIGGITVLHECMKYFPEGNYFYYGDNARAPYGNRSPKEILTFTKEAMGEFIRCGVDAVVLACNTVTAVCAETLRKEYSFPILGVEPAVRPAVKRCNRVLILATKATCESERVRRLIKSCGAEKCTLFPAEGLALEIEKGLTAGSAVDVKKYLPRGEFDGVVLGCTHYSFFKGEISAFYGVPCFDGGEGVAKRLRSLFLGKVGICDHRLGNLTTNKRSHFKCVKTAKNEVNFLNSTQIINKTVHKQTFAL